MAGPCHVHVGVGERAPAHRAGALRAFELGQTGPDGGGPSCDLGAPLTNGVELADSRRLGGIELRGDGLGGHVTAETCGRVGGDLCDHRLVVVGCGPSIDRDGARTSLAARAALSSLSASVRSASAASVNSAAFVSSSDERGQFRVGHRCDLPPRHLRSSLLLARALSSVRVRTPIHRRRTRHTDARGDRDPWRR